MTNSELLVNEFKRRLFLESYHRIFKCLSMISEEELWFTPNKNTPSMGSLILHLCGNCKEWVLSGIGNEPNNRDRDKEFEKHPNIKKSDLVFVMENLKVKMTEVVETIDDDELNKFVRIRDWNESIFSVLIHVIEHFAYHTGQITTLSKLICNRPTNYYPD